MPRTHRLPRGLLALALGLLAPAAGAQVGSVDQFSLRGTKGPALFGGKGYLFQQQVRAGLSGTLTCVEIMVSGNPGDAVAVRVRRGAAPSSQPILWEGVAVKASSLGFDVPFLDASAAGVQLVAGEVFVLELELLDDHSSVAGSIYDPPCYPEPVVPGAPAWPNLRMTFRTFMSESAPGASYCTSEPSTAHAPARIWAYGSSSIGANDLVLHAGPMPDVVGLFYYGTQATQAPFGNGFVCVGGGLGRLPGVVPHCGTISSPLDLTKLPPQAVVPGAALYLQAWFRDPFGGGGPFTFDFSDGYAVTFTP